MGINLVGAQRFRSINEAVYQKLKGGLSDLGYLTPKAGRADVEILTGPLDADVSIRPNKIAFTLETMEDEEWEMGSNLTGETWDCYIDILAESKAVGEALSSDISALLRGKMPSIGHGSQRLDVIDYRDGQFAFSCDIQRVLIDRDRTPERKHNKFWWIVGFELVDVYYDDSY